MSNWQNLRNSLERSLTERNTILHVQDVTVSFDGFTVLDHLDFKLHYGELRFLIGPNGAGKTTLLDVITGRVRPHHGRIRLNQVEIGRWSEHRRARAGLGRKFQTPSVFPTLTAFQNLDVALGCTRDTTSLFRRLGSADRDHIASVLETVG